MKASLILPSLLFLLIAMAGCQQKSSCGACNFKSSFASDGPGSFAFANPSPVNVGVGKSLTTSLVLLADEGFSGYINIAMQTVDLTTADPNNHVKVTVTPSTFYLSANSVATIQLTVTADAQASPLSAVIYVIADDTGTQGIATVPVPIKIIP